MKPIIGQTVVVPKYGVGHVVSLGEPFGLWDLPEFVEVLTKVDGIARQYAPENVMLVPFPAFERIT